MHQADSGAWSGVSLFRWLSGTVLFVSDTLNNLAQVGSSAWEAEKRTADKSRRREEERPLGGRIEKFESSDGVVKYRAMAEGRDPSQAELGCKLW